MLLAIIANNIVFDVDNSHKLIKDFLLPKTHTKLTISPVKKTLKTFKALLSIYKRPRLLNFLIVLNDYIDT